MTCPNCKHTMTGMPIAINHGQDLRTNFLCGNCLTRKIVIVPNPHFVLPPPLPEPRGGTHRRGRRPKAYADCQD